MQDYFSFRRRFTFRYDLHHLLDLLQKTDDFKQRIDWLVLFFSWLRLPPHSDIDTAIELQRLPSVRFKYFLNVLDKNEELRKKFFTLLNQTLAEMSEVHFFSEVGLSNQIGFLQELSERFVAKLLPETPLKHDLHSLLFRLFPDSSDLVWLDHFDNEILSRLIRECRAAGSSSSMVDDVKDSLVFLSTQASALAYSAPFRERLGRQRVMSMPYHRLTQQIQQFIEARTSNDYATLQRKKNEILVSLADCFGSLFQVQTHLDEFGVSLSLVFQMERLRRQLHRLGQLIEMISAPTPTPNDLKTFIVQLVHDTQTKRGLRTFIGDNMSLLNQKVVERNSEIGEHYITKTRSEFYHLFKKAGGGGILTAFTVYLKFMIASWGLSSFLTGFFASINYSLSFLAIQFSGFTLATKQPASTAPAIATKLKDLSLDKLETVVDEMLALIRSQFVAILGNLSFVAPTALIVYYVIAGITGSTALSTENAQYVMTSLSVLGPSFIYAAFTGCLLFASSLFAGWFDNWVTFRKMNQRIRYNEKFRQAFGDRRARALGRFLQKNAAALTANISLGCMLGIVPEIMKFLGLPLDVRHVTLSTGSLMAALPVLGYDVALSWPFWNAVLGIFVIGLLNVSVSFALAFSLAINAQRVRHIQRNALLLALARRISKNPLSLFHP